MLYNALTLTFMPKSKKTHTTRKQKLAHPLDNKLATGFDQSEIWNVLDDQDESFWEEFFKLEEASETIDELLSLSKITLKSTYHKLKC